MNLWAIKIVYIGGMLYSTITYAGSMMENEFAIVEARILWRLAIGNINLNIDTSPQASD